MAALRYVDDGESGITRRRLRNGWSYWDADGERIRDRGEIDRLNAIGLPPAYENAWFCAFPNGHIQAIGYDKRGRKQYRYHTDFRDRQDALKFDGLADFGRALPKLRARVEADLNASGLTREKSVAAVVRLLDLGRIRVGNEAYAKANKSYGATTLRGRHADLSGSKLRLQFKAKSGKTQVLAISDRMLARVVRRCQDLPGQHLFGYLDDAGETHPVTSTEVNDYIRGAMGADYTAKHFRTWSASALALEALCAGDALKEVLAVVAEALGNTPAIARKSYVHPLMLEMAGDADICERIDVPNIRKTKYLSAAERRLIALLDAN